MKYILILGDGMSDHAIDSLNKRTPLDVADKSNIDMLANRGVVGLVKTVPDGMNPGSDTANLSVIGYDPRVYYTGRSPLEAVSMGISLSDNDITYRCNLVCLDSDIELNGSRMLDYSAGEIETSEAEGFINCLKGEICSDNIKLYNGISYRHCMVISNLDIDCSFTPPHDILDKCVDEYLPTGKSSKIFTDIIKKSMELFRNHPLNKKRIAMGKSPVTCVWPWGEGTKPALPLFKEKYGKSGVMISAVDLLKGIGICAGLKSVDVIGATGTMHTNFRGKAEAAIEHLEDGYDFAYIHIEAPDECGHQGDLPGKIASIESIDKLIVGPIISAMNARNERYRILITPDHATPISLRTHTREAVPFLIYDSGDVKDGGLNYNESSAGSSGVYIENGHELMDIFLNYE